MVSDVVVMEKKRKGEEMDVDNQPGYRKSKVLKKMGEGSTVVPIDVEAGERTNDA